MFHRTIVRYELTGEHNGGEIPEHHAWYIPGRIIYTKDNSGWIVLACENPGCDGEALVKLSTLLEGVPLGKVLPDPPGTREKYERAKEEAKKFTWP